MSTKLEEFERARYVQLVAEYREKGNEQHASYLQALIDSGIYLSHIQTRWTNICENVASVLLSRDDKAEAMEYRVFLEISNAYYPSDRFARALALYEEGK